MDEEPTPDQPQRRVAIVTDSAADLPSALRERARITVVPVDVVVDGRMLRDGEGIDGVSFAERAAGVVGTAAPPPKRFASAFRALGEAHDAVVAVVVSSRLGRVYDAARIAADMVAGEVPVQVVDSRSASMGVGFQALRAAHLADAGLDADEIAATLRAEEWRFPVAFFVDTLDHLQQGGRIGRAAALIGEVLQLKPLLRIDEGQVVPLERTRTRARAIDGLVDFVRALGEVERVAALYTTNPADGEVLARRLRAECGLPAERVFPVRVGPTVAAHIGPGAMGVAVADIEG